jgi:hypothetical protein
MAENLSKSNKPAEYSEPQLEKKAYISKDIQDLKDLVNRLKFFEGQAEELLSKLENKEVK